MSKVEIVEVNTPLNSSSFQHQINQNFEAISEALDKQLQREPQEGVANYMEQNLNMNSNRIINLPEPVNPSDAARKQDCDEAKVYAEQAKEAAANAKNYRDEAKEYRDDAKDARDDAVEAKEDIETLIEEHPEIKTVADNIEDVTTVADNIEAVIDVSEHIEGIVLNTATAPNALTIFGTPTTTTGNINIGLQSEATSWGSVAYGPVAKAAEYGIAIGSYASTTGTSYGIAIGSGGSASTNTKTTGNNSIAIGRKAVASGNTSTAIGAESSASQIGAICIGPASTASGGSSVVLGRESTASGANSIAIGYDAVVTADNAVQIGAGTNATAGTVNVGLFQLLNENAKVNFDRLGELAIRGASDPTTSTVGTVGRLYINTTSGEIFNCIDVTGGVYTWKIVGIINLANLKDVSLSGLSEGDMLVWDNTAQKWKNKPKKYCETNPSMLTSVNGLCTWQVTHNLGTKDVCVAVYDLFTNKGVLFTDERVSENRVDIEFVSNTNIPLNTYRVVILA